MLSNSEEFSVVAFYEFLKCGDIPPLAGVDESHIVMHRLCCCASWSRTAHHTSCCHLSFLSAMRTRTSPRATLGSALTLSSRLLSLRPCVGVLVGPVSNNCHFS